MLALMFVTFVLFACTTLSRMLMSRIVLDHAAARAARARSVGLNEFMCFKSARAAMIPIAGHRLWPLDEDDYSGNEISRVPMYMSSRTPAEARGILDYEFWPHTKVQIATRHSLAPTAEAGLILSTDDFSMDGSAKLEAHYPLYMNEEMR